MSSNYSLHPAARRGAALKGRDPLKTLETVRVWDNKPQAQEGAKWMRKRWPHVASVRVFERWVKVDGLEFPVFVVVARGEGSELVDD